MPVDLPALNHELVLHIRCKGTGLERVLTFNGLPSCDAARDAADSLAEWCHNWGRSQGLVNITRAAARSLDVPGVAASSGDGHSRQFFVDKGVNTDTETLELLGAHTPLKMNRTPSKASISTSGAFSDGTSLALLAHSNSNELIASRFKLSGRGQNVRQDSKIWRLIHKGSGSGVFDDDEVSIADYDKWSKLSMAQDTSLLHKDKDSKGSRPPSGKGHRSVFGRIAHGVKSSYLGGKHDTKVEYPGPFSRSPRGRSPDKESKGLPSGLFRPAAGGRHVGKLAALPGLIRVASVSSRPSSASRASSACSSVAISPRGSPTHLYRMASPADDSPTGSDARLPLLEILNQSPGAAAAEPAAASAPYARYGRSSHARHPSQGSGAPAERMCWESRSQEGRPTDGERVPGRSTGASARLARPGRTRGHHAAGGQTTAPARGVSHASSSRSNC